MVLPAGSVAFNVPVAGIPLQVTKKSLVPQTGGVLQAVTTKVLIQLTHAPLVITSSDDDYIFTNKSRIWCIGVVIPYPTKGAIRCILNNGISKRIAIRI